MRKAFLSFFLLCLTSAALGQDRVVLTPKSSITVLVDLSATWHNPTAAKENQRILETVSDAIGSVVSNSNTEPPTVIRYLAIGDASLARPPLCEVTFYPQIIARPNGTTVSDLKRLSALLRTECTGLILRRSQEQFTDITGALDGVSRALANQDGHAKSVIVLSDLKEELRPNQRGSIGRLNGVHIVFVYRTLPADRLDSAELDARIAKWKQVVQQSGGAADALSDAYANAGTIAGMLTHD